MRGRHASTPRKERRRLMRTYGMRNRTENRRKKQRAGPQPSYSGPFGRLSRPAWIIRWADSETPPPTGGIYLFNLLYENLLPTLRGGLSSTLRKDKVEERRNGKRSRHRGRNLLLQTGAINALLGDGKSLGKGGRLVERCMTQCSDKIWVC